MPARSAEDFPVGWTIATRGRTITEGDVADFAALTWDTYPLHTDEEFARGTEFGTRIASGPLTFSYAVGLMSVAQCFGDSIIAFAGANDLRLLKPVRAGDTLHVEAEVVGNRPTRHVGRALVTMRYTVVNQRREEVLRVDMVFLMHARGEGGP